MEQLAKTIDGKHLSEDQAQKLLSDVVAKSKRVILCVVKEFHEPWKKNPSTGVRAAFGHWWVASMRHHTAITVLTQTEDLTLVANVHYRQMLEIFLQVRKLASVQGAEQERLSEKIAAWGVVDYLEKMERFKEMDFAKIGYKNVEQQLDQFDAVLIEEIKKERKDSKKYWFGGSISKLARSVSKEPGDLYHLYSLISADIHGAWNLALDVTHPAPGQLDFTGYTNKAQLYYWAAELLDRATKMHVQIWNEIAVAVGAQRVVI